MFGRARRIARRTAKRAARRGARFGGSDGGTATEASDELRSLARLRDEGVLTEAEFEAKRKKLLGL